MRSTRLVHTVAGYAGAVLLFCAAAFGTASVAAGQSNDAPGGKPEQNPPAVSSGQVRLLDYGIYKTGQVRRERAPTHVSGWRNLIDGLTLQRATDQILAQPGLSFGIRYQITDPALVGKRLTRRLIFPPMTNPKTGKTATSIVSYSTGIGGAPMFSLFSFDYRWEMAEGIWRFQLLDGDKVLLEKQFRVIIAIN